MLFLDEPSSGLDPRGRHQLWQTIRGLVDNGTAVLLTTQYLEEADQLADQIVVIDRGRILARHPDRLKAQVGGDRLQLRLATPDTARRAAQAGGRPRQRPPQVDAQAGEVTVPIADGVAVLPEVVRQLDAAGLGLSDLTVRRPTLDDVFLTLTGQTTQPPHPPEAPATGQPRPERQPATRSACMTTLAPAAPGPSRSPTPRS